MTSNSKQSDTFYHSQHQETALVPDPASPHNRSLSAESPFESGSGPRLQPQQAQAAPGDQPITGVSPTPTTAGVQTQQAAVVDLRLMLVGPTGVGKSAAGNTILGRKEFISKISSSPVTQESEKGEGEVCGRRVTVVDTPGLFNNKLSKENLRKEMERSVSLCGPGPHVFLLVIQLGQFTQQEKSVMETLQELFSERVNQYTMILFTHGDRLENTKIQDFIKEDTNLQQLQEKCENGYHVFDNEDTENCSQVEELLQKIDKMVRENRGDWYNGQKKREANKKGNYEKKNNEMEKGYSDPGGFDVICSNGSSLEVVEGVQFCRRDPSSMGQMTIGEVLRLGPRQRVGVVEVKILPEGTVSKVVAVDGVQCELKEFQICDRTGQTTLTLWDKQILAVQVSKSYRLAKLATRKSGDRTVLTSTPSTTLSEISAVGQPDSIEVRDDRQNTSMIRGIVNGVQIIGKHRCRRCHSNQEEFVTRASTHRCQRCKLLQRSTSFAVSYSGVLVLTSNGQDQSLSFTNSAICNYLKEKEMSESMKDVEAIEEHFLNIGQVDISVNGEGLIVSIQECAENELGGLVLEADFAGELHELSLEHEEVKH